MVGTFYLPKKIECFWPTKFMKTQYDLHENDVCITMPPNYISGVPISINLFSIVRQTQFPLYDLAPLRNARKKKFFHC